MGAHTHTHIYTHTHMHTHTYTHPHAYTHTFSLTYVYTHTQSKMHVNMTLQRLGQSLEAEAGKRAITGRAWVQICVAS